MTLGLLSTLLINLFNLHKADINATAESSSTSLIARYVTCTLAASRADWEEDELHRDKRPNSNGKAMAGIAEVEDKSKKNSGH